MVTDTPHPPAIPAVSTRPRPRVLLIGNYLSDAQESMLRFARVMLEGLQLAGCDVELIAPPTVFGRWARSTTHGLGKWLGYIDKFLVFPFQLRRALRATTNRKPLVVHICDHSNASYTRWSGSRTTVVTCHDLLAVRGALGEQTDCPASFAGKQLQNSILRGLGRASAIVSVSRATMRDVDRLVTPAGSHQRRCLVHMGLNHNYGRLATNVVDSRLAELGLPRNPYVLHVGSNHRRKNRDGVLRAFAKTSRHWNGVLVFAGEPPTAQLWSLAESLGIRERVVAVSKPDTPALEALYNRAVAMLFPSRFEGFGWPLIEAQASGCPVICSNAAPLPEIVGEGGIICPLDDDDAFAEAILRLTNPHERDLIIRRGLANVTQFTTERMIEGYLTVYEKLEVAK